LFFLFQSTGENEQHQQQKQPQQQQAIDEVQNTDVIAMHYMTVTGDKMTDISDDCDQQSDQRDGSSNTLHPQNIDTETVDRRPVSSCVSRQLCNNYSEMPVGVRDVERVPEVEFTDERPFDVKVEADSNDITEHPHDDKPRPYLCTVCGKQFTTKQLLNRHKQTHTAGKLYSCSQCEKRFKTQHHLKIHMNVHSSKYKCAECGKCFRCNTYLTIHGRSHSGEKPFECTVCSKQFSQSGTLAAHSKTHSEENPYKCPLCNKTFSQSGHLNAHMRVHTGDKPYKCSLCDKSFNQSSHLQRHKSCVHSNGRPFVCHCCGKMSKSSGDLKRHVRTHTRHTQVDTLQNVLHGKRH